VLGLKEVAQTCLVHVAFNLCYLHLIVQVYCLINKLPCTVTFDLPLNQLIKLTRNTGVEKCDRQDNLFCDI
jgi:hypothetical protein